MNDTAPIKYESPLGTLFLIVEPAKIDERVNWNGGAPNNIVPRVRVTTGGEHDPKRYGIEPTTVKVRGVAYTVDYDLAAPRALGWQPDPQDAHEAQWMAKTHGYNITYKPYSKGGYRNAKTGIELGSDTQANETLDCLIFDAVLWLDGTNPGWRNASVHLAYDGLIHSQQSKIENAQRTIEDAKAEIARLEIQQSKYSKDTK